MYIKVEEHTASENAKYSVRFISQIHKSNYEFDDKLLFRSRNISFVSISDSMEWIESLFNFLRLKSPRDLYAVS